MTPRPERRRRSFALRQMVLVAASVAVTLPALLPAGGAEAAPAIHAQVRVDQVGYATNATKRAYLMTSAARPGAVFSVVNASVKSREGF